MNKPLKDLLTAFKENDKSLKSTYKDFHHFSLLTLIYNVDKDIYLNILFSYYELENLMSSKYQFIDQTNRKNVLKAEYEIRKTNVISILPGLSKDNLQKLNEGYKFILKDNHLHNSVEINKQITLLKEVYLSEIQNIKNECINAYKKA